jgi:hypothetical protein
MSVVTGIMLLLGAGDWDGEPLAEVQAWLAGKGFRLRDTSEGAGGNKHPQFEAWAAGINYFLRVDEFAAFTMSRPWSAPENVVLVIQPEDGASRVFRGGDYEVDRIDVMLDEG